MEKYILSRNEESILETLWSENRPLTRSEIIDSTKNRQWKKGSFYGMLNNLLEHGYIEVDGIVQTGKNFGRSYIPAISKGEYELFKLENCLEEVNPGKDVLLEFIKNLINSDRLTKNELEIIEKYLNQEMKKH